MDQLRNTYNIAVIGGCGHVGLPIGLAFAKAGHKVTLIDTNERSLELVNSGLPPFQEAGAAEALQLVLGKTFFASKDTTALASAEIVILATPTSIDEHNNPNVNEYLKVVQNYAELMLPNSLVIVRSTVYPGVIDLIQNLLNEFRANLKLAFCPERIAQGKGLEEISLLPQIISGTSDEAVAQATQLFSDIAPKTILLSPREAEIAKLMCNSWRYLDFAIANQFYMMAETHGLDFYKIFRAIKEDYPRAKNFAQPGLAAGPCLFKDTAQLSMYNKNTFSLGHAAMTINESLPAFLVAQMMEKLGTLRGKTIAILGMTFKANNDDTRGSLSQSIRKNLEFHQAQVICSDPFLPDTLSAEEALKKADGVILGVPHSPYAQLKIRQPFVDCWGIWK